MVGLRKVDAAESVLALHVTPALHRETLPALLSARPEDVPAPGRTHSGQEPVLALTRYAFRLIGTLRQGKSPLIKTPCGV